MNRPALAAAAGEFHMWLAKQKYLYIESGRVRQFGDSSSLPDSASRAKELHKYFVPVSSRTSSWLLPGKIAARKMALLFRLLVSAAVLLIVARGFDLKRSSSMVPKSLSIEAKRNIASAASSILLTTTISTFFGSNVINADSTGKMSTKLTARKRYLPRIIADVKLFLLASKNGGDVNSFVADKLPAMVRAMNLYGLSLRKGEYPDEISREAEKLAAAFESSVIAAAAKKGSVKDSLDALNQFLLFSKLSDINSKDYQ